MVSMRARRIKTETTEYFMIKTKNTEETRIIAKKQGLSQEAEFTQKAEDAKRQVVGSENQLSHPALFIK